MQWSILDVATIVISIIALMLSIISFFQSRAAVVKDYFAQGDSAEMKKYRKVVYNIYNQESDEKIIFKRLLENEDDVAHVISFFDFWALMVKKHYLPKWAFQASSRFVAITIYDKLTPYILYRRNNQPEYACHYEWLINKMR